MKEKLRWSFKCNSIKLKVDHSYQLFIWSALFLVAMCNITYWKKIKIRIDTCACNIKCNCILRSNYSKRVHCIRAVCINIRYIDIKRCLGRNELPNSIKQWHNSMRQDFYSCIIPIIERRKQSIPPVFSRIIFLLN